MTTKLIGVLAIAIAIGLSAFTNPVKKNNNFTGTYWFLINDGIPAGSHKVPAADATFVQQSVSAPSEPSCSGGTNQCLSGFTASQVNTMTDQLKDDNQIPALQPDTQN